MTKRRLHLALAAYAALAVLAYATLDGVMRLALWIFLGGLAVKSWIAHAAQSRE